MEEIEKKVRYKKYKTCIQRDRKGKTYNIIPPIHGIASTKANKTQGVLDVTP